MMGNLSFEYNLMRLFLGKYTILLFSPIFVFSLTLNLEKKVY